MQASRHVPAAPPTCKRGQWHCNGENTEWEDGVSGTRKKNQVPINKPSSADVFLTVLGEDCSLEPFFAAALAEIARIYSRGRKRTAPRNITEMLADIGISRAIDLRLSSIIE
jgi:hypothetical protein